ncbi:MAG: flavodoxin domain-containing protein [Anaerolineae bacterium]
MSRILVAYVTHSGSTREVAEFLGEELRSLQHQVDVRPVREVADLAPYDAVVAGGLLYRFGWHPEIVRFLQEHLAMLKSRPVALFVTGMRPATPTDGEGMPCPVATYPIAGAAKPDQSLASSLRNALPTIEAVKPRSLGYFRGKVDLASLSFPEKLVMSLLLWLAKIRPGDYRDWDAIRGWARGLELG